VDDTEYNLVELFGVPYVPHNVILDHTMTVQHSTYGFNENEIIATIEQLLEDLPEAEIEPEDEQQLVPGKLLLTTPYPNPFNSRTVISYFLPRSEVVTLSVYDTRGALVTILRNRERIPAGHHQKVWYADESPSGIYFVILETPSRRESAKVLYLK